MWAVFDPVTETIVRRGFEYALVAVEWVAEQPDSEEKRRWIVIVDSGEYP